MVVATLRSAIPTLGQTLERLPEATVRLADIRATADSPVHALVWVDGVDPADFDDASAADPTVADARRLASFDGQSLYRVDFANGDDGAAVYELLVDNDGTILGSSVSADDGWHSELFFPDRESLSNFYEGCKRLGVEPRVLSLSVEADTFAADEYGLTEAQRETLAMAAREGYFSVPKDISLVGLADQLGISDQATSERLRRGMDRLIRATLLSPTEAEPPT